MPMYLLFNLNKSNLRQMYFRIMVELSVEENL